MIYNIFSFKNEVVIQILLYNMKYRIPVHYSTGDVMCRQLICTDVDEKLHISPLFTLIFVCMMTQYVSERTHSYYVNNSGRKQILVTSEPKGKKYKAYLCSYAFTITQ